MTRNHAIRLAVLAAFVLAPSLAVAQPPPAIDDNPGARVQGTAPPGVATPAPVPNAEPTGSGTAGISPGAIPELIAPGANFGGQTRLAPTGAPPITGTASDMKPNTPP